MLSSVRNAWRVFRQQLREVKAEQEGKAISKARLVRQAEQIPGIAQQVTAADHHKAAQPIAGAVHRMLDGKPMQFHTDGSVRHAFGKRVSKAVRKQLKKARRQSGQPLVTFPRGVNSVTSQLGRTKE